MILCPCKFISNYWPFHEYSGDKIYYGMCARHYDWIAHWQILLHKPKVYPKKYAHGFVVLCFVVVMQSFIMNSHEVFIHIHQGCFAGTGAIVRLPQCQWSKPGGYGKISQCITTTKHSKAVTVCIFLGIYCTPTPQQPITCRMYKYRYFYSTIRYLSWVSSTFNQSLHMKHLSQGTLY